MNVSVTSAPPKKEELPSCFGKDWDKNAPECAGGPDSSYSHPKTGAHVRDQCDYFQSCGAKTAAIRNAQGQLIPPQQLLRPSVVTPPPAAPRPPPPQQTFAEWFNQMHQQQLHATAAQNPQMPRPPMVTQPQPQHVTMPGSTVQPATTWQLNYASPPFLSTPEVRQPGESVWSVLLREVLRSMFKAMGHAVANFFDSRSLKEKQ